MFEWLIEWILGAIRAVLEAGLMGWVTQWFGG